MKEVFAKAAGFYRTLMRPDLEDAMAATITAGVFNIAAFMHVLRLEPVSGAYLMGEQAKVLAAGAAYAGVQYIACKAWKFSRGCEPS